MRPIPIVFLILLLLWMPSGARAQDELLIGLIPEENIFSQMDRHRPFATYLSQKLGVKVRLTILSRYGDIIDRFLSRKMDGAFFGVFTGVLAVEKLNVDPLVRPVNLDGTSTVQSLIFVRKDSGIRTVKDMRGKRMAFVDRATVTGYLFPVAYLKEQGVGDIERYFREYYFTGSHDSAIFSVLDNKADIGAVKSKVFQRALERDPAIGEELTVIARSKEFPDTTLCLRKDLPAGLTARIREILLAMDRDPEGAAVLGRLGALRFVPASRSDYQPFFELARKAGISLRTYRYR